MKPNKRKLLVHLLSLGMLLSLVCPLSIKATAQDAQDGSGQTAAADAWPAAPEIGSASAFLLEDSTGAILYEKAGDEIRYPGSAVKIMTMLLALENTNLTDQVTFTQTGVAAAANGAANIAAREGEVLTMEQCLYAIMLASANDACVQVAEHVSGSVEAFVEKMNSRAAELGCTNTVFTNPTGLPDENQHSTARDLSLILQAAIQNADFCTISSTADYTIPATDYTAARTLKNSFPLSAADSATPYEGILTGKAGYTQASGSTLVTAAEKNGTRLICVLLMGTDGQTASDAISLLDYGFQNFQRVQYADPVLTLDGGFAILPNGVTLDGISTQETPKADGIYQEYYYQNRLVGHALIEAEEEEDADVPAVENEAYLKTLSQEKSMVPYAVIIGSGVILLAILGVLLRKVLKA
ncbi:MAG: D-alanyl-D-alanine carboxypeptidase family protein [Blautia sp.]|jgi:D-alanyl-D-alanine carboxypeptidase (penicillin-binding protein 5/6)